MRFNGIEIEDDSSETVLDALTRDIPVPVEPTPYTATELMEKLQEAVRMLRKARDLCLNEIHIEYNSYYGGTDYTFLIPDEGETVCLETGQKLNESLAYELDQFIRGLK